MNGIGGDGFALVWEGGSLDYASLHTQANRLAHYLRDKGVGPDVCVAIAAERSPQLLVGLLAILKAGGAYVPLDVDYPAERLAYMLADCGASLLLSHSAVLERLPAVEGVSAIAMDTLHLDSWPSQAPGLHLHGDNLAYVIYTSGSTGEPKGVMVEHQTVNNLVDWHCRTFDLCHGRHTSSLAGFGFDAMAWEVWPALCVGATLHLPPQTVSNEHLDELLEWWCAQPLQVSFLPTPVAEYAFSRGVHHPTLRTIIDAQDQVIQFGF